MPIQPAQVIWLKGELVPWSEARIHVLTHGLHYGTGFFEGIRCYQTERGPAVFRLTDHLRRLHRSAAIYRILLPHSVEDLAAATKDLVRANGLSSCYVRPIAFLGYGEMSVRLAGIPVSVSIIAWEWGAYLGEDSAEAGVSVKVSSWRRNDPNTIPPTAKATGQYLNSALAKQEALEAGFDEALLLNPDGFVADGSGENVFLVRDGVLLTPPEQAGVLPGITRDTILRIGRDLGYETRETNLIRTDLYLADEVFLTGTAAEIVPVRDVDGRVIGDGRRGPITKDLQETFHAATRGQLDRYASWNEYVDAPAG
jgi:branched-chain amino acid aminotransferase